MAEPLLKRTFSKLRAKERFRRKTDPKLTEVTAKVDLFQTSTASASGPAEADSSSLDDGSRRSQITVSKKQNWAKCRDAGGTDPGSALVYGPTHDWDLCSGKAELSKQAWSQRTLEDGLKRKRNDLELEFGYSRTPCDSVDAGLPDLTPPSPAYMDACVSSSSVKISGQGAYLQHLDRSSRAWVLSTGKPQASEEALPARITEWRQGPDGDGNIWYNPIPEEDDSRASGGGADREKYGDPWRRRDAEGWAREKREQKRSGVLTQTGLHQMRDAEADVIGADASDLATLQSDGVSAASGVSADSPGTQKKSPVEAPGGSSVMERIKSPGTVRRLSMKMRKLPELRRKLSLRSSRNQRHAQVSGISIAAGASDESNTRKESSNVISKYHLDSSAPARPRRRSSRSSKGGYLSDGDSPELLPKAQGSARDCVGIPDADSFRVYSLADQPRCAQRLSGLLTVHLLGLEELTRTPRNEAKDVFCAIQVDGVTRARTSLLSCHGSSLPLNHTFNLELERARLLKLVILTPVGSASTGPARNRVCCLGTVAIPALFKASRVQHLCVRLEPRGLLYVKLTLLEMFVSPSSRLSDLTPPSVFSVELRHLVEKEASALRVPLIIQKCVCEIERRGLRVVGLYRLCGSAAVKKELRDAFERDSAAVTLTDELYPDVNVITGILKDYLRELPSPLITRTLYEVVLEAMTLRPACRNDGDAQRSHNTVDLLHCLPEPERATLSFLLDHLSLVASYSDSNRMTCQNLAVCFGPVLLTPSQESWQMGLRPGPGADRSARAGRSFAHSEEINSAVDFKRHIEALHYLLQLWPVPRSTVSCVSAALHVDVSSSPVAVVSRRGRGRLESPPCNRYAGDWSVCGRDLLSHDEADYDEVAGSESDEDEPKKSHVWEESADGLYVDDFALDFDAPFTCRLSLKDFDVLISDLERELAKQINICL